jgi:hypothetical protein
VPGRRWAMDTAGASSLTSASTPNRSAPLLLAGNFFENLLRFLFAFDRNLCIILGTTVAGSGVK